MPIQMALELQHIQQPRQELPSMWPSIKGSSFNIKNAPHHYVIIFISNNLVKSDDVKNHHH